MIFANVRLPEDIRIALEEEKLVKTNTPADFYTINSQMAGYDAASKMWSQQESFYIQVVAAPPPAPAILAPHWSGGSFSVQVATTSGFTYYLEY